MGDILAIVWQSSTLELIQLPTQGVWTGDNTPLRTVELDCPTRIGRLDDYYADNLLESAFTDLLDGVDLSLPLWILLPEYWIQRFEIKISTLSDAAMQRDHLIWEAEQRLHGDHSFYSLLLPRALEELAGKSVPIYVCRSTIVSNLASTMRSINAELAGLWIEPISEENYNFDEVPDLREVESFTDIEARRPKKSVGVPPAIGLVLIAILLTVAVLIWLMPFDGVKRDPADVGTPSPDATLPSAGQEQSSLVTTKPAEEPIPEKTGEIQQSAQTPTPAVRSTSVSPLTLLSQKLPGKSYIQLATISSAEFRTVVVGVISPDTWLKELRSVNGLNNLKIARKYSEGGRKFLVLKQTNTGWQQSNVARNMNLWTKLAGAAGMKVSGRTATGSLKSALTLIDTVWGNSAGFSKIFLAQDRGQWRVTVQ